MPATAPVSSTVDEGRPANPMESGDNTSIGKAHGGLISKEPKQRVAFTSETKVQDANTLKTSKKKVGAPDSAKAKAIKAKKNAEKIDKARADATNEQRRQRAISEASRRRDIETTVFQIQEMLLEQKVTPLQLIQATDFITPSEYADVVAERALAQVCGYPLCLNKLPKPSNREKGGRFKISMKDHRVYDMELIRQYCANDCHVASDFFSSQLMPMVAHMRTGKELVKEKIQVGAVCGELDRTYVFVSLQVCCTEVLYCGQCVTGMNSCVRLSCLDEWYPSPHAEDCPRRVKADYDITF